MSVYREPVHCSPLRTKIAYMAIGACVAVLITVVAYALMTMPTLRNDSLGPWYGRGSELVELPYDIIVGPVDAKSGITDVIELGMTKSALRRSHGKPLVPALSQEEAINRIVHHNDYDADSGGSLDTSSFTTEFFGGVFAWVRYDEKGRVGLIYFDPGAFRWRLRGTQRIIVSCRDNVFIVDENTSRASLFRLLKQTSPRLAFDVKSGAWGDTVTVRGTRLRFVFRRGSSKLKYLYIQEKDHLM